MKKISLFANWLFALVCVLCTAGLLMGTASRSLAAPQPGVGSYVIKKVEILNPTSPDFGVGGAAHGAPQPPQKWIQIETTFDALPELTEELQFNYYVSFAPTGVQDRLLVGHVNHVYVAKGNNLRSCMYISPTGIIRLFQKKIPNLNMATFPIKQVTVTISQPGVAQPLAVGSWKPVAGDWWSSRRQEEGFLLNKNETPFAALYWDTYEAIKPSRY